MIPNLADPQAVVLVDWMGHPAAEVATSVTDVLTRALEGIPGATAVRGTSMSGMAYFEVVFASAASLADGRREIVERIATSGAALPATARVAIGPDASSTGWVFEYALVDPSHRLPQRSLRLLQDEVIRPAVAAIPGVAEVASVGGATSEAFVELRMDEIAASAIAFTDVLAAVRQAAAKPGARFEQLGEIEIASPQAGGAGRRIAELAHLRISDGMPSGLADVDGTLPAVGGIVIATRNADLARLIGQIGAVLDRARAGLPNGIQLRTVYNRLDLAREVDRTLLHALVEEIAVVVAVVLFFLVSLRSALSPAAVLVLVVLSTFVAMWSFRSRPPS